MSPNDWCGWYEDTNGETVLLTQFPEDYFGEPMLLRQDGDRVTRLDRVDPTGLTRRYREWQVTFDCGGVTLAGTLITPTDPGPHPALVVAHGAAGGQRDFCRLFASAPLAAGIAVLIYDKRGHGRSGGPPEPTIFDQADALDSALDLLAGTPDLDPERLGILGVSNGMWAAPMVAARRSDVAFLAGISAPGVSMAGAEIHRRVKLLRDAGVGDSTLSVVGEAWRLIFEMAASGRAEPPKTDAVARLMAELAADDDLQRYEPPEYVRQNPMVSPLPPAEFAAIVGTGPHPELAYDPVPDYQRLTCPVYLQLGEKDTSIPARRSQSRVAPVLSHPLSAVQVYPGLEHLLNVPGTEDEMYLFRDFRFGAGVRDDLAGWLSSAVRTTS